MVLGEKGLLQRAKQAKDQTEVAQEEENINLAALASRIEGKINKENLEKALAEKYEDYAVVENEDGTFSVRVNNGTREYKISNKGEISYIEHVTDEKPGELAGEGTQGNPYLIESIEDLVAFASNVNGGNSYQGKYVKLEQDLNFKSSVSYVNYETTEFGNINGDDKTENLMTELTTGRGFTPIGTNVNANARFKGTFDGNNKKISNASCFLLCLDMT